MDYKKSRYNVTVKTEHGARVFNSRTGAVVEFSESDPLFSRFQETWTQQKFHLADHEWLQALKERGFIVPEDFNEIPSYISSFNARMASKEQVRLIVLPTEECNFRCVYCYESFLKPQMRAETQEALKRYISATMERVKGFEIEWFGGEPLAGIDAMRNISTHAVKVANEHGVSFSANVTTNGYLLTPEVFEEAVNHWGISHYQITIDGPREFHDQRRVLNGGGETYDQIVSNIAHIAKSDYPDLMYIIRMNVDRDNLKTVAEFARTVKDLVGDDPRARFFVRPVWGKSKFELLTNFEQRSLRRQIVDICNEVGLRLFDVDLVLNPQLGMCYAADPRSLVIGTDGSIYKCTSAFELPENLVGRLTPDGTIQIDRDKFSLWVESSIEKYPQCRHCAVLPICNSAYCPKEHVTRERGTDERPECPPFKDEMKMLVQVAHQKATA